MIMRQEGYSGRLNIICQKLQKRLRLIILHSFLFLPDRRFSILFLIKLEKRQIKQEPRLDKLWQWSVNGGRDRDQQGCLVEVLLVPLPR